MSLTAEDLINIRRDLHKIPELALKENQTHEYLKNKLAEFSTDFMEVKEFPELSTALFVYLQGSNPKRTIGYRADMDALPVTENNDLYYRSTNPGVMHACGHDLHMTVALGLIDYFAENQPTDNLLFFFQPAEEAESGGKQAYDLGLFSGKYLPDEFYGLHDNADLGTGIIGCRNGTLFAGTTEVNVTIKGMSGHAAYPHKANDAVVIAANFIEQVQTIISRSIDPVQCGVITFGKLEAGTIRNIIAGKARIEGTIRGLTQDMILYIRQRVLEVAKGLETSFNCQIEVEFNQGGYYPVENDPELTKNFIDYMENAEGVKYQETAPAMTGEDFGYLLSKIPGTMFWLGVASPGSLHSADFLPHEEAIIDGVKAFTVFLKYRMSM